MDINMPVMNGIEASCIISQISKSSKIVALTALEDAE